MGIEPELLMDFCNRRDSTNITRIEVNDGDILILNSTTFESWEHISKFMMDNLSGKRILVINKEFANISKVDDELMRQHGWIRDPNHADDH